MKILTIFAALLNIYNIASAFKWITPGIKQLARSRHFCEKNNADDYHISYNSLDFPSTHREVENLRTSMHSYLRQLSGPENDVHALQKLIDSCVTQLDSQVYKQEEANNRLVSFEDDVHKMGEKLQLIENEIAEKRVVASMVSFAFNSLLTRRNLEHLADSTLPVILEGMGLNVNIVNVDSIYNKLGEEIANWDRMYYAYNDNVAQLHLVTMKVCDEEFNKDDYISLLERLVLMKEKVIGNLDPADTSAPSAYTTMASRMGRHLRGKEAKIHGVIICPSVSKELLGDIRDTSSLPFPLVIVCTQQSQDAYGPILQ